MPAPRLDFIPTLTLTASIVVHLSPLSQLRKAAECILRSPLVETLYVIDNSPGDSLRVIASADGRIDYRHVENRGFGAAHNIAMKEAAGNAGGAHLVMNADVWWDGDVLATLAGYLEENPDVGMVMPKVFYPDGTLQYTCRMLPTPADLLAKRFLPESMAAGRMERYLLARHDHDRPLNCPYLLGSFLLFRNEALLRHGLFDERFFMYPEDIDITRRIHEGWRTMYWPGVSIIHQHAAASRKSLGMLWIHLRNMAKYFNKWGWLSDPGRDRLNRRLLDSIVPLPEEKIQIGKG